jgi:hypothetical protein
MKYKLIFTFFFSCSRSSNLNEDLMFKSREKKYEQENPTLNNLNSNNSDLFKRKNIEHKNNENREGFFSKLCSCFFVNLGIGNNNENNNELKNIKPKKHYENENPKTNFNLTLQEENLKNSPLTFFSKGNNYLIIPSSNVKNEFEINKILCKECAVTKPIPVIPKDLHDKNLVFPHKKLSEICEILIVPRKEDIPSNISLINQNSELFLNNYFVSKSYGTYQSQAGYSNSQFYLGFSGIKFEISNYLITYASLKNMIKESADEIKNNSIFAYKKDNGSSLSFFKIKVEDSNLQVESLNLSSNEDKKINFFMSKKIENSSDIKDEVYCCLAPLHLCFSCKCPFETPRFLCGEFCNKPTYLFGCKFCPKYCCVNGDRACMGPACFCEEFCINLPNSGFGCPTNSFCCTCCYLPTCFNCGVYEHEKNCIEYCI